MGHMAVVFQIFINLPQQMDLEMRSSYKHKQWSKFMPGALPYLGDFSSLCEVFLFCNLSATPVYFPVFDMDVMSCTQFDRAAFVPREYTLMFSVSVFLY